MKRCYVPHTFNPANLAIIERAALICTEYARQGFILTLRQLYYQFVARALLERRTGCTAVAAGNDMLAIGCLAALEEMGLNCPADMSVVGFNDMPFIDRLRPPLTTIRFPHYQLGTEAAQLLLERIGGQGGPVRVIYLAPELVVRGSTAPCRQTG